MGGGWLAGWSFRRVVREPPRRHLFRGSPYLRPKEHHPTITLPGGCYCAGLSDGPPKHAHVLIPRPVTVTLQSRRDSADVTDVMDLEMGRLSWIIWEGPK